MEAQWSLVLFTVISGAGAWLFATSMMGALAKKSPLPTKVETIAAIVLLAVGGVASVTHLKHIDRIFEALNHPTSGIFVEAALIGVLIVLALIYLVMLVRKSGESGTKIVGVVTMIIAVIFPFMCGYSYMMEARQAWMTIALPLSYWATAAVAGAGLNLLLKAIAQDEAASVGFAGILTVICSAAAAVCSIAFFVYAGVWLGNAKSGCVAWIVATFACIVIAFGAGALAVKKAESATAAGVAATAAGAVCAIALRVAMWLVGTPLLDFFLQPLD